MNQVSLNTYDEDIFLADVTTIIANLYGDNDYDAVRNSIESHPDFENNYQKLVEYLFAVLEKKLAPICNQYKIEKLVFSSPHANGKIPTALCNHTQATFDVLMALTYMPLHRKYDHSSEDLKLSTHAYFWWEEQENDITCQKILELFDFASQESKSMDFEVVSDFKGKVFGVEIDNQAIYDSMTYLYDVMTDDRSDIFDDKINIGELVIDLMHAFKRQFYKTDCSDSDIENELAGCISLPDSFSELRFEVFNSDLYFADINDKIKNGDYLIKNT